jgi:hypothetical protein
MWSNICRTFVSFLFTLGPVFSFSQTGEEIFVPENFIHIKLGTTTNLYNAGLFKSLNDIEDGNGRFTPATQVNFNPLAEIDFERQMTKHFGLMLHLGFTQTRGTYIYDNNTSFVDFHQKGSVIANIPNFGLMPVFYIKNTRFMIGSGFYKYYFRFRPMDAGYIHFNLNLEGSMIYNRVSVMQTFKLSSRNASLTASYFGFQRKFDNGFQLALGIEI